MRRKVRVRGVEFEDGSRVEEGNNNVLSVYVLPDKSVDIEYTDGIKHHISNSYVSYTPRTL